MLEDLMNFDRDATDLDDMVSLFAFGKSLLKTYEELELEAPEKIRDNMGVIENEIRAKSRDNLERAEREIARELEGLKTKEEKKNELLERQARVRAKLGK